MNIILSIKLVYYKNKSKAGMAVRQIAGGPRQAVTRPPSQPKDQPMSRDRIFLLQPGFEDPKQPGKSFFCPYSNQIEGVLASHPGLAAAVEIQRLPYPRPRRPVVDLVGEENQSLPLLVLGEGHPVPSDAATAPSGLRYLSDTRRILEVLAERHGIPQPH